MDIFRKIIAKAQKGIKDFCISNALYVGEKKDFVRRMVLLIMNVNADIKTHLEDLKPMYVHCDCGKDFKYLTNMDQDTFNYKCINCGDIVKIRINKRGTAHTTDMKNLGEGGAWEKIWNEYREIWRFVLKSADRIVEK